MTLKTDPNWSDPDGFYQDLLDAHDGLDMTQSSELNARLIFILANQIGARETLKEAIDLAKLAPAK